MLKTKLGKLTMLGKLTKSLSCTLMTKNPRHPLIPFATYDI